MVSQVMTVFFVVLISFIVLRVSVYLLRRWRLSRGYWILCVSGSLGLAIYCLIDAYVQRGFGSVFYLGIPYGVSSAASVYVVVAGLWLVTLPLRDASDAALKQHPES